MRFFAMLLASMSALVTLTSALPKSTPKKLPELNEWEALYCRKVVRGSLCRQPRFRCCPGCAYSERNGKCNLKTAPSNSIATGPDAASPPLHMLGHKPTMIDYLMAHSEVKPEEPVPEGTHDDDDHDKDEQGDDD